MTVTFTPGEPIWCAGCGHFAVLNALVRALDVLAIPPHETMVLAGIGCSGTIQNNIDAYGYHALHGRVLATATGMHLANSALTVIAAGGDGDGYAIGAGHLVHTFKRNPSIVYILMNNGVYGLTKGQGSPTADAGASGGECELDGISLGLAIRGSTFLARGYSGAPDQLNQLLIAALEHSRSGSGFAFVEVMSPCVTYNDTYSDWPSRLLNTDDDANYNRNDRAAAFSLVNNAAIKGLIPTGLIFQGVSHTMVNRWRDIASLSPAHQSLDVAILLPEYSRLLDRYIL